MEVSKAIKGRRSIRRFKPDPVKEGDLNKILDAGRWAPSAGNMQPLELVVVKDQEVKDRLAKAALGQLFVAEAPVTIVVCAKVTRTASRYGERGSKMYIYQDTAAAAQNIHLMAYSLGYSTCWVGAFNEDKVAEVINAPADVRPLALIPVGKPAESPGPPPRLPLEEITHLNKF